VFRAGNLLPLSARLITGVVRAIIIAPGLQKAAKQVAILIWLGARVRTAGTRTGAAGRPGRLCTQRLGNRAALIDARDRSVSVRADR